MPNITEEITLSNTVQNDDTCGITETQEGKKETQLPILGQRHFIVLWGFSLLAFIYIHRIMFAVIMVAMVNHTQIRQSHYKNSTTESCAPDSDAEDVLKTSQVEGEFDWDSQMQGNILGVHSFSYIFSQFIGGRVAEIWGAKRTLFCANFFTALLIIITPFCAWWNYYLLIIVQLARGLFEGFISPGVYVVMVNWYPRKERGMLSSFTLNGFTFGAILGALVSGWLCDVPGLGWPSVFYVWGGVQLLLSILFAIFFYEMPKYHPHISKEELKYITSDQENELTKKRPLIPWRKILTSVPVHALGVGMFGLYWTSNHFLAVHPTYMGTILHYNMTQNGMLSALPFFASILGTSLSGIVSGWITKNNLLSTNTLRKGCSTICFVGFSFCLVGVILAECNGMINVICFTVSLFFTGIGMSGTLIVSGDMSPTFAGSIFGIASAVSSSASTLLPIVVGAMTKQETLGEWHNVFYLHIGVSIGCCLIFQIFGSAEIQPWNTPDSTKDPAPSIT